MTTHYDWMWLAWLPLAFWLAVVAALVYAVWHYRNYPEQQALIARCHAQHEALMDGDDTTGVYGNFPPANL